MARHITFNHLTKFQYHCPSGYEKCFKNISLLVRHVTDHPNITSLNIRAVVESYPKYQQVLNVLLKLLQEKGKRQGEGITQDTWCQAIDKSCLAETSHANGSWKSYAVRGLPMWELTSTSSIPKHTLICLFIVVLPGFSLITAERIILRDLK